MPTETLYPTAVTSPSSGGNSCSGTVRARTCDETSNCGDGLVKGTADHRSWSNGSFSAWRDLATLKVAWRVDAQAAGTRDCENNGRGEMRLKYSINNGSSFAFVSGFPKTGANSSQSGTASISLSPSQDLTDVKVRINCQVEAPECATGACCYGPGDCTCRIDTEAACGNGYQGDGTACVGQCYVPEICDPPLP